MIQIHYIINYTAMGWTIQEFPGYLGKKRDEVYAKWDKLYGKQQWRIRYQWGNRIVERGFALQIYEDGYYEFFKSNPRQLEWLIRTASDVYDTAPTNTQAGFSYDIQETPNNHVHDVAIRRAIARLGKTFEGDHPVHVRDETTEGFHLNPGNIPFHLPEMILEVDIEDYGSKGQWWNEGSIEDFYQKNKVIQVKEK